jgi:hypothetical protein
MRVYPNEPNAHGLRHPNGVVLKKEGADWPGDGFTFRLLTDGTITEDAPSEPPAAPVEEPAGADADRAEGGEK